MHYGTILPNTHQDMNILRVLESVLKQLSQTVKKTK